MKIAVVGAGISGLGAAWLLSQRHDVVLFEKEPCFGGHSHTVDVPSASGTCPVDTGFIVYNTGCYPNLIALFNHLQVPTAPTDMSFAVSLDDGRLEYNGNGITGLFGQPSNVLKPAHWRMARDIFRFFREAQALGLKDARAELSLGDWLKERGYSTSFIENHILPMGAAIWSTPAQGMLDFPAAAFARFFANHGLLQVSGRPAWRTVRGGSREYVARLMSQFKGRAVSNDPVIAVAREGEGVRVTTRSGGPQAFDRVLLATHATDALAILEDPSEEERALLAAFKYTANHTVLHTDAALMPKRRRLWTSWNYMGRTGADAELSVTYWMNQLQPLGSLPDHFITLNPVRNIDPARVLKRIDYEHPLFDRGALEAQKLLWRLQGRRQTWFAGSYFGYGFHEDGLQAGLAAAEEMGGVRRPWTLANPSDRLVLAPERQPRYGAPVTESV